MQYEEMDPFLLSADYLLVIAFPKSSSKNYPFALDIAEKAGYFGAIKFAGKMMHMAAFGKSPADASKALALLDYVRTWKGTLIFSHGRIIQYSWQVPHVINCFLDACSCNDPHAHCDVVIDDPYSQTSQGLSLSLCIRLVLPDEPEPVKQEDHLTQYIFPCKYLYDRFRLQINHTSTPQNQIEAAGVREGCSMCPNFDPDRFGKIGVKSSLNDAHECEPSSGLPRKIYNN